MISEISELLVTGTRRALHVVCVLPKALGDPQQRCDGLREGASSCCQPSAMPCSTPDLQGMWTVFDGGHPCARENAKQALELSGILACKLVLKYMYLV